jgi:hypothetical protein
MRRTNGVLPSSTLICRYSRFRETGVPAHSLNSAAAASTLSRSGGWSTVHMARRYTDVVEGEDLRAAEHVDRLHEGGEEGVEAEPHVGQRSEAS